jgi:hypothetical protein
LQDKGAILLFVETALEPPFSAVSHEVWSGRVTAASVCQPSMPPGPDHALASLVTPTLLGRKEPA